jgi:hypothetical protein
VQWMVGGDLNVPLHELPATYWLGATGWKDVHEGATCIASRTIRARRIDVVLCNRHVQSRVNKVELQWGTGMAVHAVHLVQLQGGPAPKHRIWKAGRQYGEQVLPKAEHQRLAYNLLKSTAWDWEQAKLSGVNAMWSIIELVAHEFHSIVSGKGAPPEVAGRYAWQTETPGKVGFAADATSVELRQAARRKRQLQHLLTLQGSASATAGQASKGRAHKCAPEAGGSGVWHAAQGGH